MTVERRTLDNGLTVLVERSTAARAAVSVHYGVGFRSEPPGREGFAHLFEHLMFRGSQSLPENSFHEHLVGTGGYANGTTHQDYTDYYQVCAPMALERALFAEADRMRAPVFSPATLAQQLAAIGEEINAATVNRPYGGFPWPLLPAVLYERHANAHDGYGSPPLLAGVTPDDCADFFDRHYTPGNAVLTVTGNIDPGAVLQLVERHFGAVPARTAAPPVDLRERPLTGPRRARHVDPLASDPAVAIGYRMPDPRTAPADHLAAQVAAALLAVPPLDSSCGFFGPLDARDPDPLVLAARQPAGAAPDELVEAVSARLVALAAGDVGIAPARAAVLAAHLGRQADLVGRCRALGRSAILFGDASRVDELPGLLATVDVAAVARAASGLAQQHPAVLSVTSGPRRPAPVPARVPVPRRGRTAAELAAAPGGPLLPPPQEAFVAPPLPEPVELRATGGVRLLVVRDDRSGLVELAGRIPYPAPGLLAAEQAAHRAAAAVRAPERAAAAGGTFDGDWDGYRLHVSGQVPVRGLPAWSRLLGDWLAALRPGSDVPVPRRAPDLWRIAADVLRRRLPPSGVAYPGCLAVVGPVTPADVTGVDEALSRLVPAVPAVRSAAIRRGAGTAVVPVPGSGVALVSVSTPNFGFRPGRADWFLALTALGGHPGSRLAVRAAAHGTNGYVVDAGYDRGLGTPRCWVRATAPPGQVHTVLADVRAELGRLVTDPLDPAEVAAAAAYAAPAALAAFDSPADLAGALCATGADGAPAGWLGRAAAELHGARPDQVTAAGRRLFPGRPIEVVVGDVDGTDPIRTR